MNELNDEKVVQVVDGNVVVSVRTVRGDANIPTRDEVYREAALLDNGWVRCVGFIPEDQPDDADDEGEAASYYPPGRVAGVYGQPDEVGEE